MTYVSDLTSEPEGIIMTRKLKSLLCGAALAGFVIAPTVPGFGQTGAPHAPPAPPAPPAAPAAPPAPHWATAQVRTFGTQRLKFEDIVGTVIVSVRDSGPMTLEVSGAPNRVAAVHVSQDGDRLVVEGTNYEDNKSVWDWHNWFNFDEISRNDTGDLFVKVSVPRGTDVNVEDLVGNAYIGDTMGPLRFEAAATTAKIGHVTKAKIDVGGSGHIEIAGVSGALDIDMGGSGKIVVGSVGSVKADIAGSGDAQFGDIPGGLSLDIAGSGNVVAAHVNGPTHIDIAGSGSVRIADGIANPLNVDIMGAGNLYFGGVAVDPHIDAVGAGTVHIKAYRGKLNNEGMADVKIGD